MSSSYRNVEEGKKMWIPTCGSKKKQGEYSVGETKDEYEVPFVQISSDKVDKVRKSIGSDPCQNFQNLKYLEVIEKDKGHGLELGVESKTIMDCNQPKKMQSGPDKVSYQNFLKLISIFSNPKPQVQESISSKYPSSSKRWADPNRQKNTLNPKIPI